MTNPVPLRSRERFRAVLFLGGALLALASGCLKVKDQLTLQADGSGTVTLEVQLPAVGATGDEYSQMFGGMGNGVVIYPPISAGEARRMFPAPDFQLEVTESDTKEGPHRVLIHAAFKDVQALLASPYGQAHALVLERANGQLQFKALTAMMPVVSTLEADDAPSMGLEMAGMMGNAKKEDLAVEYQVTLPHPVNASNGTNAGATVTWAFDRSKMKDGPEAMARFRQVLTASCDASGLKLEPHSPVRLALLSFGNVPTGSDGSLAKSPSADAVKAAARFVPYKLTVQRMLDLAGEGGSGSREATLIGALEMPVALAPQQLGKIELVAVTDNLGNDLRPPADENEQRMEMFQARMAMQRMRGAKETLTNELSRQLVTLQFKPPAREARSLKQLKATAQLQYAAGGEIVKLDKAIAADAIQDMSKNRSFRSEQGKALVSEALSQAGLTVTPQMVLRQGGRLTLALQSTGSSSLTEVQVYDQKGDPWPTMVMIQPIDHENSSCQVVVMGNPAPPLSLAVVVRKSGGAISVPIELADLPLTPTPTTPSAK